MDLFNTRRYTLLAQAFKFLISSLSNAGKTTLTCNLEDTLVISHDGKRYPWAVPHVNVGPFVKASDFVALVTEKIQAYETKYGKLPKRVVIDTVSKIFDTLMDSCNVRFKGFEIYSQLNKEIHEITNFIEETLITAGISVILLSHATWKEEDGQYSLVGKGKNSCPIAA